MQLVVLLLAPNMFLHIYQLQSHCTSAFGRVINNEKKMLWFGCQSAESLMLEHAMMPENGLVCYCSSGGEASRLSCWARLKAAISAPDRHRWTMPESTSAKSRCNSCIPPGPFPQDRSCADLHVWHCSKLHADTAPACLSMHMT